MTHRRVLLVVVGLVLLFALPVGGAHPHVPDCGSGADAPSTWWDARAVVRPVSCDAWLNSTWDSTDFYKVTCMPGDTLRVTVTSDFPRVNVRIYPPAPVPVWLDADYTREDTGRAHAEAACTVPGEYRVQLLYGGMNTGTYDVPYHLEIP